MDFFDIEGPFMRFLDRIFNLLWLNLIVVVFCLPVFTAGAAFTGMHYVMLRLIHNEEGYVFPNFKKSFKQNFKQATKIWIVLFLMAAFLGTDLYLIFQGKTDVSSYYKMGIYVITLVVALGILFVFPVLAHYDNSTKATVKNAYMMAVYGNLKALIMLAVTVAPWVAAAFVPNFIFVCLGFGFSVPAMLNAYIYEGIFKKFELAQQQALEREEQEKLETESKETNSSDN